MMLKERQTVTTFDLEFCFSEGIRSTEVTGEIA